MTSPARTCLKEEQNNVMSSARTCLMEEQKGQALIRRRAFCVASDQGLAFLSLMNSNSEHFCHSLCNFNRKYYHKRMKIADLGCHCLFLHKAGFCRRRHIYRSEFVMMTLYGEEMGSVSDCDFK